MSDVKFMKKRVFVFLFVMLSCSSVDFLIGMESAPADSCSPSDLRFTWLTEDQKIAGMRAPQSIDEMVFLVKLGIGLVVTLTEDPLPEVFIKASGLMRYLHIPIADDGGVVSHNISPEQIAFFLMIVQHANAQGLKVVVHCKQGVLRTGFMLACWLVIQEGFSPFDAMAKIKKLRGGMAIVPPPFADLIRKSLEENREALECRVHEFFS